VEAAPARPAPPAETKPARPPADTRTAAPSPPPPAASPIRPQAADAGGRGAYTLQLGVFSNPANAQEMLERLRRQGVHAYLETRVLVGPFADRNEAQRAHAELKRMGISGLLSRPAASQ
jgi:DedD protein